MDRSLLEGYVNPATYLREEGVEILKRSAQVVIVPYLEIRAVYFVRDFDPTADLDEKRVFGSRPKFDGLWIRAVYRDEEVYEGVIPNDLLQLTEQGVTFTPPEPNSNVQRVFVPRRALSELKVLGVIGSPVHRRRAPRKAPGKEQLPMFSEQREAR